MRNLTIKRESSFVGWLAKSQIYIEDPNGDTKIAGVNCRRLGAVKNGGEETFEIGHESLKVFVISDKLSKDYSNDFYIIPEGDMNIHLSGKCEYNPTTGNAFRFYNNDSGEAGENRKKNSKTGIIILVIALVVGFVLGFASVILESCAPMDISYSNMTMTVTADFVEDNDSYGYDACFANDYIAIFIDKHSFADIPELKDYTLTEYGNYIIDVYDLGGSIKSENGLKYYEYTNTNDGDIFKFRGYIYEDENAFWSIEFGGYAEDFELYEEDIEAWAASVVFE